MKERVCQTSCSVGSVWVYKADSKRIVACVCRVPWVGDSQHVPQVIVYLGTATTVMLVWVGYSSCGLALLLRWTDRIRSLFVPGELKPRCEVLTQYWRRETKWLGLMFSMPACTLNEVEGERVILWVCRCSWHCCAWMLNAGTALVVA